MLVIRFFRVGKKSQPFFKIVVTDKRRPAHAGRFVEEVGFYNPLTKEKSIKKERVDYWLSKGARPSDTCRNLFIKQRIIKGSKIPVHKKSKKEKKPASAESLPAGRQATAGKEAKTTEGPVELRVEEQIAPLEKPVEKPVEKKEAPKPEAPKV